MILLLADENLALPIVRGVLRHAPEVVFTTVQAEGLSGASDDAVLDWASTHERTLVTHDANTVPAAAYERIAQGNPMPGVVVVPSTISFGAAVDDLVLLATCAVPEELHHQVVYLPLRSE